MEGALMKKLQVGMLAILLVTNLMVIVVVRADETAPLEAVMTASIYKIRSEAKENQHKVGMPLYRVKNEPEVLIPAYKVQSTTFSRSP
ncbi:hypothetical protein FNV43_RR24932 [Rhamnella rubrinervis]|uniref:Uncharacterized protein n=1 Tax=Rhamnella rubrinervis TaxID=2594499 RepID=A0A8K0DT85_9ROSA|nr:hypothetical protein FNV43_RR24932 [Rhamnella rubrinervis]